MNASDALKKEKWDSSLNSSTVNRDELNLSSGVDLDRNDPNVEVLAR